MGAAGDVSNCETRRRCQVRGTHQPHPCLCFCCRGVLRVVDAPSQATLSHELRKSALHTRWPHLHSLMMPAQIKAASNATAFGAMTAPRNICVQMLHMFNVHLQSTPILKV